MPSHRVIAMIVLAAVAATAGPSSQSSHNMPGQRRTRTAVAMKGEKVPLRFSDGTPTGFYAWANDPSKNGDGGKPLADGFTEMDAQEVITTDGGMRLLLHPGGGPSMYDDPVEHGQYGHVALEDLKNPPTPRPQNLNGKPAPLTGQRYYITPTLIPHDMFYKPNADEAGRTGSTYFTYGNPGYDKTRGRGDWTYICWSWVQNGTGADFPANKTAGGGLVRAVAKRDQIFYAADVAPIVGYSWGPDNKINGRVTAIYGKTFAGPGESGSEIWGWIPLCYQKSGDIVVPCLRRANAARVDAAIPVRADAMERAALNLASCDGITGIRPARPGDVQWKAEVFELARVDNSDTLTRLMNVLGSGDAFARRQSIALIAFLNSAGNERDRVTAALTAHLARTRDEPEEERVFDALKKLARPSLVTQPASP